MKKKVGRSTKLSYYGKVVQDLENRFKGRGLIKVLFVFCFVEIGENECLF